MLFTYTHNTFAQYMRKKPFANTACSACPVYSSLSLLMPDFVFVVINQHNTSSPQIRLSNFDAPSHHVLILANIRVSNNNTWKEISHTFHDICVHYTHQPHPTYISTLFKFAIHTSTYYLLRKVKKHHSFNMPFLRLMRHKAFIMLSQQSFKYIFRRPPTNCLWNIRTRFHHTYICRACTLHPNTSAHSPRRTHSQKQKKTKSKEHENT